ncbi:MAG: 16S rRNA (cytidine(1402)-2'-O)-methyltransferase [Erysipelotrichaceae bacterium]
MSLQKSFSNKATLFLVATPIGNLQEMTPRAIDTLKGVAVVAAEDTRNTRKLLSHFDIKTKLIAHHKFNEVESTAGLIKYLQDGKDVALVSDAGYPLISDPGEILVKEVIAAGFSVVSISGSSAMLNALVASGITTLPFYFHGFLPSNNSANKKVLKELKTYPMTLIFYESVHRIARTLENMLAIFGDRNICVARELTKLYEEFYRGSISDLLTNMLELKGEFVVIVEGCSDLKADISLADLEMIIREYQTSGLSVNAAIKKVALEYNVSKNALYRQVHKS